jgi:predicted GNAT family acetyltransferase
MQLTFAREPADVPPEVDVFLASRVERNVLATVLAGARQGRFAAGAQLFGWSTDGAGAVCAVALRTTPHPLLCSELAPSLAPQLLAHWLQQDPQPSGVSATLETARALAAAWNAGTGGRARLHMAEAMHVLEQAQAPSRPAAGELRAAREHEVPLLGGWERAFAREAGVPEVHDAESTVAARLTAGTQLVWDDGEPVCTVCFWPPIAGTARIGPVYTPPERRARGYGSSAVAAAAARLLQEGARRCMLFTDLSNPTSNRIYASVGFRRHAEWEWYEFPAKE